MHPVPVPNDVGIVGLRLFTQAVIVGGGVELCNALDLVVGLSRGAGIFLEVTLGR